jgi:outer membrane lipoprotein-sorting protein
MNGEQNKKLDRLLSEAVGGTEPTFDFAKWQADHPDAIQRYRQLTREKSLAGGVPEIRRIIMNPRLIKFAVAAVIIVAVIVGLYFPENRGSSSVAFAAVIERIQSHSYAFELSSEIDGKSSPAMRVEVLEPGRVRIESDLKIAMGPVSVIVDLKQGKNLILFHGNKSAILKDTQTDFTGQLGVFGLWQQSIENLWNLRDGTEKVIGQKDIDGRKVQGFKIHQQDRLFDNEITVWADVQTGVPVMVEIVATPLNKAHPAMTWKMTNFTLNVQLDPKQFSIEPPTGYTLANQKELKDLVAGGSTSAEADKITQILERGRSNRIEEAVESLLKVDFKQPIQFSGEPLVFSLKEKGYVSLKFDDQQKAMKQIMSDLTTLRQIAKTSVAQGQQAMQAGQTDQAEKAFAACQCLGRLLVDDPDLMVITRMVGLAIERLVLKELVPLYEKTGETDKLRQADDRQQYINEQNEAIKRQASGGK